MRKCLLCLLLPIVCLIFLFGWLLYVQGAGELVEAAKPVVAEQAKNALLEASK